MSESDEGPGPVARDETVRMLAEGLMTMLKIQARQGEMLEQILAACTAPESEEPSPLVQAVLRLDQSIQAQTAMLTRIEAKVSG